ncbi:hypothetical protein GCM10023222_03760 [Saccharopolyspora cebuensis]
MRGGVVEPLTLKELVALLRSGEVVDGPLADFAADYGEAARHVHKKDD